MGVSRSLLDRLGDATASCVHVDDLASAVFAALPTHVPFAFACLAATDPASGVITRTWKSAPLSLGDEEFAAAEYGAPDVNQFTEITRRAVPVAVLSIDTDGDVHSCRRFREFMAPVFGFTDELRAVCRSSGTSWGAIALYRGPGEPAFTQRDANVIETVLELLAHRLRHALFADGMPGPRGSDGPAVLMVDGRDRVTTMTTAAQSQIDELGGWDHGSLPANLLAVATLARTESRPMVSRALGRSGRWLALRAMPLDSEPSDRSLVLTIDAAPQAEIGQLRLAAHGLTAREQDVARLVLQGASTKDIAGSLFLSPHTVQDHLKAVFAKLGVSSRREMVAQVVLGDSAAG